MCIKIVYCNLIIVLNVIKSLLKAHTASNKFILMYIYIQFKYSIFTSEQILLFPFSA